MSFGGYAAPFVQGSTSFGDWTRRVWTVWSLVAGYLVGSTLFGLALFIAQGLTEWLNGSRAFILALLTLLLALGDVWAIKTGRLYPLAARRQAQKALMYREHSRLPVGFVWGLDAGLAVTTYRVTSGSWILAVVIVLGYAPAWLALALGGAFASAFLAMALLPVRAADGETVEDAAIRRIMWIGAHRRIVQIGYLGVLPVAVLALV